MRAATWLSSRRPRSLLRTASCSATRHARADARSSCLRLTAGRLMTEAGRRESGLRWSERCEGAFGHVAVHGHRGVHALAGSAGGRYGDLLRVHHRVVREAIGLPRRVLRRGWRSGSRLRLVRGICLSASRRWRRRSIGAISCSSPRSGSFLRSCRPALPPPSGRGRTAYQRDRNEDKRHVRPPSDRALLDCTDQVAVRPERDARRELRQRASSSRKASPLSRRNGEESASPVSAGEADRGIRWRERGIDSQVALALVLP
jgi:hypothetical protein